MFIVLLGLLYGIMFMITALFIALAVMIPSKISLTILCKKLNLKFYGLLWIPIIHGWYEGALISYCWNKEKRSILLRIVWTILHALFYLIPISYFVMEGIIMQDSHVLPDYMTTLLVLVFAVIEVIYIALAVIKFIAMRKAGKSIKACILIGIFLPFYWALFMHGVVKKNSSVEAKVVGTANE